MLRMLIALVAFGLSATSQAAVLEVGEGKSFATLQAAASAAADGDTIKVAAGTYTAGAVIAKNRLTIAGANRSTTVFDNGVVKAKGILLITGDDVTVRDLTLQNAASIYAANAAGIRQEGRNLNVVNVTFRGNKNGILYTATNRLNRGIPAPEGERGHLKISDSYFIGNGSLSGQEHGVYASGVDEVTVFRSRFESNRTGHHLKSRALKTTVTYSTFVDGQTTSPASFHIDLPEGGAALIANNEFWKGTPDYWVDGKLTRAGITGNYCCVIAYGFEMTDTRIVPNPAGPVVIRDNFLRSRVNNAVTFFTNRSTPRNNDVLLSGNRLSTQATLAEAR